MLERGGNIRRDDGRQVGVIGVVGDVDAEPGRVIGGTLRIRYRGPSHCDFCSDDGILVVQCFPLIPVPGLVTNSGEVGVMQTVESKDIAGECAGSGVKGEISTVSQSDLLRSGETAQRP